MEFSSAIRIADFNDYIAPSQECVVALNGKIKADEAAEEVAVQLQPRVKRAVAKPSLDLSPAPLPYPQQPPSDPVKVSLHDCLACSGCVTSAETVLLQQQSVQEFEAKLADPGAIVVVTVSPQSRAALAAYYGLPPAQAMARLVGWLKGLGVRAVWDLTTARDLALMEAAHEFMDRYRAAPHHGAANDLPAAEALGGGDTMDVDGGAALGAQRPAQHEPGPLPVMASACPGWVVYAEKTQGARVLPYLSTTRSPQGVMGGLVKRLVARAWGVEAGALYHTTLMPCYDKKLEASRDELMVPGTSLPEVDCCLTTGEVLQLLQRRGPAAGLGAAPDAAPDALLPGVAADERLYGLAGSSGGYAEHVLRCAARELAGRELPAGPLPWKAVRNTDFQEVTLDLEPVNGGAPGTQALRVARVYGFRNIQTLLRQVKAGRCNYHYVEIMACPSGCLNGGGQIKLEQYAAAAAAAAGQAGSPAQPALSPQALIEQLELAYAHQDVAERQPWDNPAVAALYREWLGQRPGSEQARALLHTQYRARDKTVTATVANW